MNTKITKSFDIDQPIDLVWKSLADPEDIVTCVPGASITEKVDDRNYKGAVVTKFGPIKASYAGDIEIIELDEVNHKMTLKGRGLDSKGKGSADMVMVGTLSDAEGPTHVDFNMDITIIGTLAQFGSRLINDVSDQLLNQFVANFQNKLAEAAPTSSSSTPEASSNSDSIASAETTSVKETASQLKENTTSKVKEQMTATEPVDNSLNATSLIGTVIKSIFGGILDFIKGLFGMKKS